MWFLNKSGLKIEVNDKEVIARLVKDSDYKEVKNKVKKKKED